MRRLPVLATFAIALPIFFSGFAFEPSFASSAGLAVHEQRERIDDAALRVGGDRVGGLVAVFRRDGVRRLDDVGIRARIERNTGILGATVVEHRWTRAEERHAADQANDRSHTPEHSRHRPSPQESPTALRATRRSPRGNASDWLPATLRRYSSASSDYRRSGLRCEPEPKYARVRSTDGVIPPPGGLAVFALRRRTRSVPDTVRPSSFECLRASASSRSSKSLGAVQMQARSPHARPLPDR